MPNGGESASYEICDCDLKEETSFNEVDQHRLKEKMEKRWTKLLENLGIHSSGSAFGFSTMESNRITT